MRRPTQAASGRDVPAEPNALDSSHRTLAQILARLKSYWSSGLISGTVETLLIAPGESTMAALGRTEHTDAHGGGGSTGEMRGGGGEMEEEERRQERRGERRRRTLKERPTRRNKRLACRGWNIH